MVEDSIRFLHLSDTHFGVHYALKPRNLLRRAYGDLFFLRAEEIIREAISVHKIDFIIHSGDFFNSSKPPPEVVDRGVKPFQLAAKKGIPVFIIPGNHERSRLPLGLLPFSSENLNIFTHPRSFLFEKNGLKIKITGFPYIRHNARNTFSEVLRKAWENYSDPKLTKYDYSILVVHQLIAGCCIENYIFRSGLDVVPLLHALRKFNYIACGHVHRFQFLYQKESPYLKSTNRSYLVKQDNNVYNWHFNDECSDLSKFPNPIVAYAGSLERVSFMERNEPKGYLIGELKSSKFEHRTMNFKCQFHELPAVKMIYNSWDLLNFSLNDCLKKTLNEMYDLHSTFKSDKNKGRGDLSGIIEIIVKGRRFQNNALRDLKEEANKLNFYLKLKCARNL